MSTINTGTTNIPIPDSAYARRRRETELSYMTAWQQIQPKPFRLPDAEEERQNNEAVKWMVLLAALDYFIYDLIDEMEAIGKYRHANKRNINRARDIILNAHNTFYKRLYNYDFGGCKQYNDAMEVYYKAINDCVALEAPERAYNIVMAICRLQAKKRGKVTIRTYAPSFEVDKIPQMLEGLGIKDYHLDNIIEQRINKIKHTK
jgi:hypothetical protein